jgi:hypothetical protein
MMQQQWQVAFSLTILEFLHSLAQKRKQENRPLASLYHFKISKSSLKAIRL